MKIRTWLTKDIKKFISKSGNGKKIPMLELDDKTKLLKPKLDKDGQRVYHDMYDDIQKFKDTNSLERILKTMSGEDIENLSIVCDSPEMAKARSVDYTNVSTAEAMADLQSKLAKAHLTTDDLLNVIRQSLSKKSAPEKKQPNLVSEKTPEKDVKKDENKK